MMARSERLAHLVYLRRTASARSAMADTLRTIGIEDARPVEEEPVFRSSGVAVDGRSDAEVIELFDRVVPADSHEVHVLTQVDDDLVGFRMSRSSADRHLLRLAPSFVEGVTVATVDHQHWVSVEVDAAAVGQFTTASSG